MVPRDRGFSIAHAPAGNLLVSHFLLTTSRNSSMYAPGPVAVMGISIAAASVLPK